MTRLEAAEMRFLRSVKGYTRLDKIRSEVIRNELEICGMQDVRSKHKQNWINHLEKNGKHQTSDTRPQLQNLEEKEIVDALVNHGNASMPERVSQPNPWRKMMMMMKMLGYVQKRARSAICIPNVTKFKTNVPRKQMIAIQ
jgi:hypothetical protein